MTSLGRFRFAQWSTATVLAAVLGLSACGSSGGSAGGSGGSAGGSGGSAGGGGGGAPSATEVSTDPARCDASKGWTQALSVRAQTADEVPYLSTISACTSDAATETLLYNDSDIVWDLKTDTTFPAKVQKSEPSWQRSLFLATIPSDHKAVMEPGSWVIISASPDVTNWFADPELTSVWQAQAAYVKATTDLATDQVKEALPDIFAKDSERGKAIISCGLFVYDGATTITDSTQGDLGDDAVKSLVEDVQGLGQAGADCKERVALADEVDLRAGRIKAASLGVAEEGVHDASAAARITKTLSGASILRAVLKFHR